MENSNLNYFDRYYTRVKNHRRKYFFERLNEISWRTPSSFKRFLKWILNDFVFLVNRSQNILFQIRTHGSAIRQEYGQSYLDQLKGYMYVCFKLRNDPIHYRTRLLFKEENWRLVDDFVLKQFPIQLKLVKLTSGNELSTLKNKFEFNQYCISKNIQTPEVIAVVEKGKFTYQKFDDFIPHSSFFIKNLSGGKGARAKIFKYEDGTYRDRKNVYSSVQLKNLLKAISINKESIIVQPILKNHNSWMNFTPGSLATCRIVTARTHKRQNIIPLFCCFRMPVGDLVTDNYSRGGIISPVDLLTGKLGTAVTSTPIRGKFEFIKHPDTQHQIEGEILPEWRNVVEFTLQVHRHFKTIFVGWDVSLTENGICMIEGNIGWASGSYEIPFQDSLKNTTYPKFFEKWMEKYE